MSDDKNADAQIHMLFEDLPVSDKKLELLKKETCNDQALKIIKEFTLNGWPTNKFAIPADVKPFYPLRSEITVADDLLFIRPIFFYSNRDCDPEIMIMADSADQLQ